MWRGLLLALAVTATLIAVVLRPDLDAPSNTSETGQHSADSAVERAGPGPRLIASPSHPGGGHSERWEQISSEERASILLTDLEGAMETLREGRDVRQSRATAEAALTALRPELYATPDGRARHQALEQSLDALTGRRVVNEEAPR